MSLTALLTFSVKRYINIINSLVKSESKHFHKHIHSPCSPYLPCTKGLRRKLTNIANKRKANTFSWIWNRRMIHATIFFKVKTWRGSGLAIITAAPGLCQLNPNSGLKLILSLGPHPHTPVSVFLLNTWAVDSGLDSALGPKRDCSLVVTPQGPSVEDALASDPPHHWCLRETWTLLYAYFRDFHAADKPKMPRQFAMTPMLTRAGYQDHVTLGCALETIQPACSTLCCYGLFGFRIPGRPGPPTKNPPNCCSQKERPSSVILKVASRLQNSFPRESQWAPSLWTFHPGTKIQ